MKPLKVFLLCWVFSLAHADVVLGADLDKSALLQLKSLVSDPSGVLMSWNSSNFDSKSALLQLKSSVSNPSGVLISWNLSNSIHCSWFSVSCDSNSRVLALNVTGGGGSGGNLGSFSCAKYAQFPLYGSEIRRTYVGGNIKLVGLFSLAIAKLTELKVLSFPFNDLSGEMPIAIWGMEKLEVLDVKGIRLPSHFGGLRNLRVLNLGFNGIVREIPFSLSDCMSL